MDILFASNNINKHIELQNIFKASECKHNLVLYSDIPEVLEDKLTIEENAQKKAQVCFEKFQIPIIADDSGLFVKALSEKPGVHSKRYAGETANDSENIKKIVNDLNNVTDLSAKFRTVLCFYDGSEFIFSDGILIGKIILSPRGNNGFGYDSIFEVEGKTLAEMTLEEKSQISHRKIATVKLVKLLNEI